jgi:hypothetical protein
MLRLESENEKPRRNVRAEERPCKVIIGPDDDDPPPKPKPEPPPKPKLKGLLEWIADFFRRGRHKQATVWHGKPAPTGHSFALIWPYAPIAAFSRTAK